MKNNKEVTLTYGDKSFTVEGENVGSSKSFGSIIKIDRDTSVEILNKYKLPHLLVPSEALIVQDKDITIYPQYIHINGFGMLDKKRYYVFVTDSTEVIVFKIIK